MAKKSKSNNKPNISKSSQPANSSAALKSLLSRFGKKDSDKLVDDLPEEKRQELVSLLDELQEMKDTVTANAEENERRSNELDAKDASLDSLAKELSNSQSSLDQDILELGKARALYHQEMEQLKKQKSDATLGFLSEREKAFAETEEKLEIMRKEADQTLQKRRKKFDDEVQEIKSKLNQTQQTLQQQIAEFKEKSQQLDLLKNDLEEEKESNRLSIQRIKRKAELAFESDKQELTNELELLQTQRTRDAERMNELRSRLSGYSELERQAKIREIGGPMEVLSYVEQLEASKKDLQKRLQGRNEEDLEQELEMYQEMYEDYRDRYDALHQRNLELQQENTSKNIGVREKLELKQQLELLEKHNGALKASISALSADLDDLMDKQASREVFPQLLRMDRELSNNSVVSGVSDLASFVVEMQHRMALVEDSVLYYDLSVVKKLVAGLAMSQLHIYQGISGTGKTSIVKAFAKAMGGHVTTVPVQAGWRDRDDILGHYNAFEKRYYEKECLQGLYRAQMPKWENRLNLVLLDEMNLSRPEQYFAEFLSALEMREGEQDIVLMDNTAPNAPEKFKEGRKVSLSSNLWIMGTANHDETTFEFADKTHDRSFVLDLHRQEMPENWEPNKDVSLEPIDIYSLKGLFAAAINEFKDVTEKLVEELKHSDFAEILESKFGIGWGSRLEMQAKKFIPVYLACSENHSDALKESIEHLLLTRILRKGKVLDRFDVTSSSLEDLSKSCEQLFTDLECSKSSVISSLLSEEISKKADGAF